LYFTQKGFNKTFFNLTVCHVYHHQVLTHLPSWCNVE
jgi:hypothetical protein